MSETARFELARDSEVYVSIPLTITGTFTQPPPPARHPEDSTVGGFSLSTIVRGTNSGAIDPDLPTEYIVMTSDKPFYYHIAQEIATTPAATAGDSSSTLPQDTLLEQAENVFSYDGIPTETKSAPTMYDTPDRQFLVTNSLARIREGDDFEEEEEVDLWMITTGRAYAVAIPIPQVSEDNTDSRAIYVSTISEQPVQVTTGTEVE